MRLYFAYGSNLWKKQMQDRCPGHVELGVARLTGYRWIVTTRGFASIIPSPQDYVEGFVYQISESNEHSLDRFEGVKSKKYYKTDLDVCMNGATRSALVYIDFVTESGAPKPEYIIRINSGISDAGLSAEFVEQYIRPVVPA